MTNHVLLDNVTHKDLKVRTDYKKGRGYDVNVARVFPVEFSQLQAEYPLFFIKNSESGHFDTIALLGFTNDENLYLTENGWDAASLPFTIERLPFLIGFQEQDVEGVPTEVPVVHIDLDHPGVGDEAGQRVFLEHGGESPYLERITSVLMTIHQGQEISQSFSKLLVGLELIESLAVDIELADGARQGLAGLYTINEEKLRSLNANALESLHRRGYLEHVYMMLASMANLSRLIARKNQLLKS
jgi:hypothetical protein